MGNSGGKGKNRTQNGEEGVVVGEGPPLIKIRNVTEKAEPLILNYCLNILQSPIMRFDTKIEKSSEFCLWKHNSEKAHVQIENPAGEAPPAPPCTIIVHSSASSISEIPRFSR